MCVEILLGTQKMAQVHRLFKRQMRPAKINLRTLEDRCFEFENVVDGPGDDGLQRFGEIGTLIIDSRAERNFRIVCRIG